jgi:hypothetical protein
LFFGDPLLLRAESLQIAFWCGDHAVDEVAMIASDPGDYETVAAIVSFPAEDHDMAAGGDELAHGLKDRVSGSFHECLAGNSKFLARSLVDPPAMFGARDPHVDSADG